MPGENETVDNIERNIDIAIEAQDGPSEATVTPTEGEQTGTEQQPQDSDGGESDSVTQQKPVKEGAQAPQPAHGPKDLKLQDGTVIKGGAERRFYEQREIAKQQLNARTQELEQTRTALQNVQSQLDAVTRSVESIHGTEPSHVALGVRIVTDMQRDPVGTLKKLLAEAAAQGYSIDEIGSGIDMAAVTRLIDERLPLQDNNTQPSDQELLQEATQEANNFFSKHPDAKPHDTLLAKVLRDHPNLQLEDAYYQVKDAFIERGYDWSLSLEQNVGLGADPANAAGQQPQNRAPLPAGNNAANAPINSADVTDLASNDMDTGDIVRQAMRESGLNI